MPAKGALFRAQGMRRKPCGWSCHALQGGFLASVLLPGQKILFCVKALRPGQMWPSGAAWRTSQIRRGCVAGSAPGRQARDRMGQRTARGNLFQPQVAVGHAGAELLQTGRNTVCGAGAAWLGQRPLWGMVEQRRDPGATRHAAPSQKPWIRASPTGRD